MGSTKELAEAPGRGGGLRASEEVLSGLRGALSFPAAGAPAGFPGQGGEKKEARGPLRPAGPGCLLYRGRSHLRLWLAQEAGTRGGDARPRAFGGRPERWLRGRQERDDVAADAAGAAEDTRSPWVWSPRPRRPSHPEDQEAGRGGGAASAARLCCGNALAPSRSASAGRGRYCSCGRKDEGAPFLEVGATDASLTGHQKPQECTQSKPSSSLAVTAKNQVN